MSQDSYRIDSHKLHFHPERVAAWKAGELIAPVYMEISPSGACNHRCTFCGLDFMGYAKRLLSADLLIERQRDMSRLGLKSVMYAGEGEPFLHPEMGRIAVSAKEAGLDVAFTTNASRMAPDVFEQVLPASSWIKASFNAGSPETYARIHGVKPAEYHRALENLRQAARFKARRGLPVTLGLQSLLLPDNAGEMRQLALICRDAGLDYFVVKPYSQHPQSLTRVYGNATIEGMDELAASLTELTTPEFSVIVRLEAMRRAASAHKGYERCLATPFWSYLDAGGKVWGCSVHLGDERFLNGDIHDQDMEAIWFGERRRRSTAFASCELDASACRVNCRMDPVNRFLWDLANPSAHVNFI